jgi:hypothetical protein
MRQAVCYGEPGSMYALPARLNRHQSLSAWAVISGPLSQRKNVGALAGHPASALSRRLTTSVSLARRLRPCA